MAQDLDNLEQEIARRKEELDELWYKRNAAKILGDDAMEWQVRFDLAKVALENCSLLARDLRFVNDSVANELDEEIKMVTKKLEDLAAERNLDTLHSWYKEKLASLLNKAEQEGLLVSEMRRKEKGHPIPKTTATIVGDSPTKDEALRSSD